MDIVLGQSIVEGAREHGVENSTRERERHVEKGAEGANDGCGEAAQSGEQGEEANQDFNNRGNQSNNVGNEHPFCSCLVCGEAIAELWTKELVHAGIVQAPDFDWIEPEFIGVRRAVGDIVRRRAV